jgi:hypothetical protein
MTNGAIPLFREFHSPLMIPHPQRGGNEEFAGLILAIGGIEAGFLNNAVLGHYPDGLSLQGAAG